jgi:hypothetical protein
MLRIEAVCSVAVIGAEVIGIESDETFAQSGCAVCSTPDAKRPLRLSSAGSS